MLDIIIAKNLPSGVYQIASNPISKYDLIKLIAGVYGKNIEIEKSEEVCIDRSLDGSYFRSVTGYTTPSWQQLIEEMKMDNQN